MPLLNPFVLERTSPSTVEVATRWRNSAIYISPTAQWLVTVADEGGFLFSRSIVTFLHVPTASQQEFVWRQGSTCKATPLADDVNFAHVDGGDKKGSSRQYAVVRYQGFCETFQLGSDGYVMATGGLPENVSFQQPVSSLDYHLEMGNKGEVWLCDAKTSKLTCKWSIDHRPNPITQYRFINPGLLWTLDKTFRGKLTDIGTSLLSPSQPADVVSSEPSAPSSQSVQSVSDRDFEATDLVADRDFEATDIVFSDSVDVS